MLLHPYLLLLVIVCLKRSYALILPFHVELCHEVVCMVSHYFIRDFKSISVGLLIHMLFLDILFYIFHVLLHLHLMAHHLIFPLVLFLTAIEV